MIVDLHLDGKTAVIVGGGREALKRIRILLKEGCSILALSPEFIEPILSLERKDKIKLKKQKIGDPRTLWKYKPDLILATTNDAKINEEIVKFGKKQKILSYSSSRDSSDFSFVSILEIKGKIKIGISTSGKSPILAKKIKQRLNELKGKIISEEEIILMNIQERCRIEIRKKVSDQWRRREALYNIMNDKRIIRLIKDHKFKEAERLAIKIVGEQDEL